MTSSFYLHFIISIHAPREGGDMISCFDLFFDIIISIHAPREGGDNQFKVRKQGTHRFQSTPPARGATKLLVP